MAKITVPPEYNLVKIMDAAGAGKDIATYIGGELHCIDVDQATLDAAFAGYDHTAELRGTRLGEIKAEGYALIDAAEGDERQKQRSQMQAILLLDEHTRRGGNRTTELNMLQAKAEAVEAIYAVIDQAEIDLATHNDPMSYTVVWPS